MIGLWIKGLVRVRFGRLLGTVLCLACAVALLIDLGLFIDQGARAMTQRALQSNSTDFQVLLNPGTDQIAATSAIQAATKAQAIAIVGYANLDALELTTQGTVQTTGAGKAVGLPQDYFANRSGDLRILAGDLSGAVLLQQTAANLHAQVGDRVTLRRPGLSDAQVPIAGIIDLKSADAFFQAVGVPAGTAPTAPPDNAVLIPFPNWQALFAQQAEPRPDTVRTELHVVLDRTSLPSDPNDAFAFASNLGRNIEARLAGSASLANNLAAQLDAARGDALYAKVLFLFLGAPGAILAAILALIVARSGRSTRARDQALLRRRGATPSQRFQLLAAEAAVTGTVGALLGLFVAVLAGGALAGLAVGPGDASWILAALAAGVALSMVALLSGETSRLFLRDPADPGSPPPGSLRAGPPLWQRLYLDGFCLVVAGIVFWRTAATGYQIVLATEGVTATSVDYTAFLGPLLLWVGGGFLAIRSTRLLLDKGRGLLAQTFGGLGNPLAIPIAAALSWQRARIALAASLVALAVGFLVSTAIFNATYEAQARVDAELTNGADVTVTGSPAAPAGDSLETLRALRGVQDAEPMQHRFAYVGTDLQDLYGIDPTRLGYATDLSNAYFANGNASQTMTALAKREDAVLVSEETVNDFQLQLGDAINLRLQGTDHAYHVVPFTFSGVAREFPTAPHDSFLVANAAYVAAKTGVSTSEVVLVRAKGDPQLVKAEAEQAVLGKSLHVTSLLDAVRSIGSNLTAVDLKGLSRIELVFALLLGVVATGLNLALGFADRRRDFAVLRALGATRSKLAGFVWAEAAVIMAVGAIAGTALGGLVAEVLIVVLQGVFDPPPEAPAVPWPYLVLAALALVGASGLAVIDTTSRSDRGVVVRMREDR